jgi:hypothetical protein
MSAPLTTLKQGPLLHKLKTRLKNAQQVDLGLGQTSLHDDELYLKIDDRGYLMPINIEQVSSIDGEKSYFISKSWDSLNVHLSQKPYAPGSQPGLNTAITSTLVDENNRYAYLDKEDGQAYQLLYNNGTNSYYYTNSIGNKHIFPAENVEKYLGQVDKSTNTVYFSTEIQETDNPSLDPSDQKQKQKQKHSLDNSSLSHSSQWETISKINSSKTRLQLRLLADQMDNDPINHPEILQHFPFLLPKRSQNDGLNASLQALFHLNSINQVAKRLSITGKFHEWYPKHHQIGKNITQKEKREFFFKHYKTNGEISKEEISEMIKLNTALEGVANFSLIPPIIKIAIKDQDQNGNFVQNSLQNEHKLTTSLPPQLTPQHTILLNHPTLINTPIPQIPELITDTLVNSHEKLYNLPENLSNRNDPKILVPSLLRHLQLEHDFLFSLTPSQAHTDSHGLLSTRNDIVQGVNTTVYEFDPNNGQNKTDFDPSNPINMDSAFDSTPYHIKNAQFVRGIALQDQAPLLNIRSRIHQECSCGLKGNEYTLSTSSIVPIPPHDLLQKRNSIQAFFTAKQERVFDYVRDKVPLPNMMEPLPCQHHMGIDRGRFVQKLVTQWRADSKAKHFGLIYPRFASHPGAKREVYNNMSIDVPFLAPLWSRDKHLYRNQGENKSTNVSLFFLQSFLVYETPTDDSRPQKASQNGALLPTEAQLTDNSSETPKQAFKTYGNISSNGCPSWWYEYCDDKITKVPIDTVVNASKRMYIGFYTRMPLKNVLIKYYHNIYHPRLKREMVKMETDLKKSEEDRRLREKEEKQAKRRARTYKSPTSLIPTDDSRNWRKNEIKDLVANADPEGLIAKSSVQKKTV